MQIIIIKFKSNIQLCWPHSLGSNLARNIAEKSGYRWEEILQTVKEEGSGSRGVLTVFNTWRTKTTGRNKKLSFCSLKSICCEKLRTKLLILYAFLNYTAGFLFKTKTKNVFFCTLRSLFRAGRTIITNHLVHPLLWSSPTTLYILSHDRHQPPCIPFVMIVNSHPVHPLL